MSHLTESHEGCFHRRSVDLGNTSLYHYFKNYGRPYFLVVGDVGTGHRGTSVMTIYMYPRHCHVVIAHDHGRPIPTSPTTSAIPSTVAAKSLGAAVINTSD